MIRSTSIFSVQSLALSLSENGSGAVKTALIDMYQGFKTPAVTNKSCADGMAPGIKRRLA
jgi:hypothetical protein